MTKIRLKLDNGDSSPSEAYILVVIGTYARKCVEILPESLTERACACAVEYSYRRLLKLDCIVHEVCHSLKSLIGPHASDVYIPFE